MTTATQTTSTGEIPRPAVLNGVNTELLFGTIGAVKAQRELAKFTFRASNRWVNGTHSVSKMERFDGAGGTHEHKNNVDIVSDHPEVLCGTDNGPSPVEYLLSALAGCLTAGIGNIAAARGVQLQSVESTVEGDADLQGILGLSDEVRNGYSAIRVSFKISGDATEEKLRAIVEQSRARSAVFDVITNRVPVSIDVEAT